MTPSFDFNPFTGKFDEIGDSTGSVSIGFTYIQRQISNLSVASDLTYLQHDMILTGTLTLVGSAELLVI